MEQQVTVASQEPHPTPERKIGQMIFVNARQNAIS
jgi:hypothetical protein